MPLSLYNKSAVHLDAAFLLFFYHHSVTAINQLFAVLFTSTPQINLFFHDLCPTSYFDLGVANFFLVPPIQQNYIFP